MRWFTTFLLILLVAGSAVWLWKGNELAPKLGLPTPGPAPEQDVSEARTILTDVLASNTIQKIELTLPGQEPLTLLRGADGTWTQPGNWPVRQEQAQALSDLFHNLRTLFRPISLAGDAADPKQYGLDPASKRIVAKVDVPGQTVTLTFGQPPLAADEASTARPTYVQVNTLPEVLRLPPDVMAALQKQPDAYRGKRLFPDSTRAKITGGEPPQDPMNPTPPPSGRAVPLLGERYTKIQMEGPEGGIILQRVGAAPEPKIDADAIEPTLTADQLANVWEVQEIAPTGETLKYQSLRDRIDPAKLRTILTTIPELWAEKFITGKTDTETGLDKPERTIVVTPASGNAVTLRLGKVSRTDTKVTAPPPASPFGPPPQPTITTQEYRFAKLDNNPLVFEVRSDTLKDLFAPPADLRDAQLARFETANVTTLTVNVPGKPAVTITRKKGNPTAENTEDREDRWYVGEILAESAKVTELLDQLGRLEARGPEALIDNPDDAKKKELGLTAEAQSQVAVTVQDPGEPAPAPRTLTYLLGKANEETKKVAVQLAGYPSVALVDEAVVKLVDRPALAYRGRRLFDTAQADLASLAVRKEGQPAFTLAKKDGTWSITQPVATEADATKASQLVGDLSRLEAVEYVDDAPTPADLDAKYGLAKPRLAAVLGFTGTGAKERTLEIGKNPEGKTDVYARLDGGSVFTIPNTTIDTLQDGAVALLPQQLWTILPEQFTAIAVERASGEKYTLTPEGNDWKLAGPFEAKVPFLLAQPMLSALGGLKAEQYEELVVSDPAKYGLDKPTLKLTLTYKQTTQENGEPKESMQTRTLVIGKPAMAGATYYAQVEGGATQAVFTIPEAVREETDRAALDLLDRSLLFLDPDRVAKIAIAGSDSKASITLVKSDKGSWQAEGQTFPLDAVALEGLVSSAARPQVQRIAGYGPMVKWNEFGLEKPEYTLTVTMAPAMGEDPAAAKTHTIQLGKPIPAGGRFARIDSGPAVAVLQAESSRALARGKLDFVDRTLLSFDPTEIVSITRTRDKAELEIVPGTTGGWDITKPAIHKADGPLLDELSEQLARLRAVSVADYGQPDLKSFGLDKPTALVTLKLGLDQPKETILEIGKPVDDKKPQGDRYVRVAGSGDRTIGVLVAPLANRLLASPLKFRDRNLARFVDADRVTIDRGERKAVFAKVSGTWKMVEPVATDAEQGDLDELINALARLRADELVADKPKDLKPYGLDKPEATVTLAAGGKDVLQLLVGTAEKNGARVHAKLAQGDLVVLLDAVLANRVLGEYRQRAVWTGVDAAQIETLAISSDSSNFALRKVGMTWVDTAKPTEPIATTAVNDLLGALAGLKAERYVADKDADLKLYGLEPPERVIVLNQKGGVTKTLHLGRYEGGSNDTRVYARVSEPGRTEVFVLSAADTEKLMRNRAAFAEKK